MGSQNWPIVLIELVLVFGGTLAFAWWQLRSIERDRRDAAKRRDERPPEPPADAG